MGEQRNIVVLGASAAGLQSTHYILKHILPALKAKKDAQYHVGAPRVAASSSRLAAEKIVFDLHEVFKQYSTDDFTFIEASATGLDTASRAVTYQGIKAGEDQRLFYHALVVATGSKTYHPAFSSNSPIQDTLDALALTNEKVQSAKSIIIVGGGPTAVEFAGEVAEHRNGKPGWFSNAKPKAQITLITSDKQVLPSIRPAGGKRAEAKLKALGVDVRYNSRVTDSSTTKDGKTSLTLGDGEVLEADYYVPAYGVAPNSSWLPKDLLNDKNYLITNAQTLRVDVAGPRVYALGDIASYSRNNIWDILNGMPVMLVNMKRDLMSYNASLPDGKPNGKDRLMKDSAMSGLVAPIGSGGGVGEIAGWKVPSIMVWMLKGRDYMVGMSGVPTANGDSVKKEIKWTAEEAAI